MKISYLLLPIVLFSASANAQEFCEKLGKKLNQINYHSIVHSTYYNYTVSGVYNHSQATNYEFNTYIKKEVTHNSSTNSDFDASEYVDADDPDIYNNYFNKNKSTSTTKEILVLEGCAESSNTAQFTIKRTVPALNTGNQQNGPSFTIYFTNWGNGWRVSNVNSSNCNNLIHQSLVNSFRSHNNEKRRYANESFYTHDLKNMTDNEICPAHINKLTTVFSNYVANL